MAAGAPPDPDLASLYADVGHLAFLFSGVGVTATTVDDDRSVVTGFRVVVGLGDGDELTLVINRQLTANPFSHALSADLTNFAAEVPGYRVHLRYLKNTDSATLADVVGLIAAGVDAIREGKRPGETPDHPVFGNILVTQDSRARAGLPPLEARRARPPPLAVHPARGGRNIQQLHADFAAVHARYIRGASLAHGLVFPTVNADGEYVDRDGSSWEVDIPNGWNKSFLTVPPLANTHLASAWRQCEENVASLATDWDRLEAEGLRRTIIPDTRVSVASITGATEHTPTAPTMRISLEGERTDVAEFRGTYAGGVVYVTGLDDGGVPTMVATPLTEAQLGAFMDALDAAGAWLDADPRNELLVHCSQGQSRSVLFATLLLARRIFARRTDREAGEDDATWDDGAAEALVRISSARHLALIDARWATFLPFIAKLLRSETPRGGQ